MISEFSRYLVVGVGSNIVNFMCYLVLYSMGISLYFASFVGYISGLYFSYMYGRIWVFGRRFSASKYRLFLFISVYFVGGVIMSTVISFLNGELSIDYRICWIIGASLAVLNNFFGQKLIVFRK